MNILGNQRKTRDKKKKKMSVGKKIVLVLILVILVAGSIFAYKVYKNGGGLRGFLATAIGHNQDTVKTLPKIYCLLVGKSQNLTDTIMIAEYDPQNQQASLLSIPRDTFIGTSQYTATPNDKINSIYSYRGVEGMLTEINELTGLNVQYYLIVDTEAFKVLVDTIGGVTFDVPIDMKYDDNKQNLHIDLKAGVQVLDGDKAEQLVRFRHNNDGSTYPYEYGIEDYGRMRTQRAFLTALAKQTLVPENIFKINQFIDIANQYVETNLDFNAIKDYIPYIVEFNVDNLKTEQLPGESVLTNGVYVYLTDEQAMIQMIDELFLNPTNEEEIDTSGIDTSGVDKEQINIELLNGSNSSAKVERIQSLLEDAGYTISNVTDTSYTEQTVIINRGNVENAALEEIKLLVDTQVVSTGNQTDADITIIIGA